MVSKTLTVCSSSGLSNRLKVLVSGLAVAEASAREFVMLWPLTPACACPFEALFANLWNVYTVAEEEVNHIPSTNGWFGKLENLMEAEATHLQVRYVNWLVNPDEFAEHGELWNRCLEYFQQLQPVPQLQARIDEIVADSFLPTMIGVHIRRGDFIRARPEAAGNTANVLAAVDSLLVQHSEAGLLLCTDDGANNPFTNHRQAEGIGQLFQDRYGERVTAPVARSLDRHVPEAIQDALVELMLLRRTDMLVGTAGSSFSELASLDREIPVCFLDGCMPSYRRFVFWMRLIGIYYVVLACARLQFKRNIPFKAAFNYYKIKLAKPVYLLLKKFVPGLLKRF